MRSLISKPIGAAAFLAGIALATTAGSAFAAATVDKVRVSDQRAGSDAPIYIADAKGYFKAEGIAVDLLPFNAGAQMIAPLGIGELDVGGGLTSAAFYNAASRGVRVKIVAGRTRIVGGDHYMVLAVRKDLVESGKFTSLRDLKGKKIALPAPGAAGASILNEAAKAGGITYADIEKVYLGFADQLVAFRNGAIDGSIPPEPYVSSLTEARLAVPFASVGDFFPNYQNTLIFFSERFAAERRPVAIRFLRAYLRAMLDYQSATANGHYKTSAAADDIVRIVAAGMKVNPALLRDTSAPVADWDIHLDSMRKDLDFFKSQGSITDPAITVESTVDLSMLQAALKSLGL
jgi:NitT/TauT family transport system substrate-binding protein